MLTVSSTEPFTADELKTLFSSVGWGEELTAEMLWRAIRSSSHCITARSDGVLAGVVRSMDDGIWSANIDCLVVHRDYQRQGIAGAMLDALLRDISHIQYISVSPNASEMVPFYQRHGFLLVTDGRLLQRERREVL